MKQITKPSLKTKNIILNAIFILAAIFIVFYVLLVSQIPSIDQYMIPRFEKLNNKLDYKLNSLERNYKNDSEKLDKQKQHLDEMNKKLDKKLVEVENKSK